MVEHVHAAWRQGSPPQGFDEDQLTARGTFHNQCVTVLGNITYNKPVLASRQCTKIVGSIPLWFRAFPMPRRRPPAPHAFSEGLR